MLNKLGRKRITITVGKRKPTLADEVDNMVSISVTKTDNSTCTEVRMPKPRPEGVGEPLVWHGTFPGLSELGLLPTEQRPLEDIIPDALRGCTKAVRNFDESPYPEKSIYQTTPQKTFEEVVPGALRDIQDKLAGGFDTTLKETAGIDSAPPRQQCDWSDLD